LYELARRVAARAEDLRLDCEELLLKIEHPLEDSFLEVLPPMPGAEARWDGRVLKFVVPDYPPRVSARGSYERKVRDRWLGAMINAYTEADLHLRFEKAFIVIALYLPYSLEWDPDNRTIKHIINAIRYLRLVETDSWRHVSYAVVGEVDKANPRTEVYVFEWPWNGPVPLVEALTRNGSKGTS